MLSKSFALTLLEDTGLLVGKPLFVLVVAFSKVAVNAKASLTINAINWLKHFRSDDAKVAICFVCNVFVHT